MDCAATLSAASLSFSPILRATMAAVATLNPMATENSSVSTASVSPTVATASALTCATQNISTTANSDSMAISRTMGIASRAMARPMRSLVKSRCESPWMASRIDAQTEMCGPRSAEMTGDSSGPWDIYRNPPDARSKRGNKCRDGDRGQRLDRRSRRSELEGEDYKHGQVQLRSTLAQMRFASQPAKRGTAKSNALLGIEGHRAPANARSRSAAIGGHCFAALMAIHNRLQREFLGRSQRFL